MSTPHWAETFRQIHERGVERCRVGHRDPKTLFNAAETQFLASIGHTAQEVFDFVDDLVRYGGPSFEDALLVAAVRRDYFLLVQKGKPTGKVIEMDELPPKSEALAVIPWLPRLIVKAEAKLRGEMPDDLMFCCGGDRDFFERTNILPADFLRYVWLVDGNKDAIVEFVKQHAKNSG
ncbi:MAG: DUF5069 domain-containing protein [Verrucomicrobia bacterium]|nr:DUF5069 domain-containing protein [Verrucomicrobiota bacterium]